MQRVKLSQSPQLANRPPGPQKMRQFSIFISVITAILLACVLGLASILQTVQQATATTTTVNLNCTLIVPANPLTAKGLATPYQLTATNPKMGPCIETNPMQSAFVQGAIINPATGQIFVYNPLSSPRAFLLLQRQ